MLQCLTRGPTGRASRRRRTGTVPARYTGAAAGGALRAVFALSIPAVLPAAAQPPAPSVRLVEDLRLDATSADFPTVSRVFVGRNGEIVVPIVHDMQLRIHDSTGRRLAAVGRRGGGPGEFEVISGLGWIHDTMWVTDRRQFRTTFVSPEHRIMRSERWAGGTVPGVSRGGEIEMIDPLAILANGSVLGRGRWIPRDERGTSGEAEDAIVVRHPDRVIRLVLRIPTGRSAPWAISTFACCTFSVPFTLQPRYSVAFDGQYLAELSAPIPTQRDATFQVTLLRAAGDTVFSRSYPYRGDPIPRRAQDSALARVVPAPDHLINVPADLPERVRAEARTRMPSWYITVESILLGLDRTIWVGFRPTAEGRRYLALSSGGEPVGQLLVPNSTRLQQATAARIWVTETDADGLSDVVRYRVSGLACNPGRC